MYEPAVTQFIPYIFQVGIPHVVNGEYEAILVLIETFPHIGKELNCEFLALLIDLGQVDYLGALGFGHFEV